MEPAFDLHSQIDQMNVALREWREAQRQLEPIEARLKMLTERGADMLDRWADVDQRHIHAIAEVEARLREFREVESRLQHEALERLRAFERTLHQEWSGVREMHEEPLRQVREQAMALAETCRATADLSLRSYERAEARLAALESDLRAEVGALTREVRTALEIVRAGAPAALPPPTAAPFPLDSVMRIHEEMRGGQRSGTDTAMPSEGDAGSAAAALTPPSVPLPSSLPSSSAMEVPRSAFESESLYAEVSSLVADEARATRAADRRVLLALAGIVLIVLAVGGWWLRSDVTAKLDEASGRVLAAQRAVQATESQLVAAKAQAERQNAAAEQAAVKAALLGDVLAAPDLVRFAIAGINDAEGAQGQVLWSRLRGLSVNVVGLRPPASGTGYVVWLLSPNAASRAGMLVPGADGRATMVTKNPANLPVPVNGLQVTVEPIRSTSEAPSGTVVLVRAVQP